MKVVAINGSQRVGGNTEFYLTTLLHELDQQGIETELISLRGKEIKSCTGCYGCLEKKVCVQDDDFEEVFTKMHEADGIVLGSPVYVSRVSSLLSALLERATFCGRGSGRLLSGKVGAPVTVARRAGQTFAFAELLLWYFINDMIIPGSMYWNVGVAGAKGAKDAESDLEGIEIVKYFSANMVKVLKALKQSGHFEGSSDLEKDKLFFTPKS